jgi:hypothetical protein
MTGAIAGDNRFLLQKYFLQILAGISNAEVVLDPDGVLVPGVGQQVPFSLTDADTGVDVILLAEHPEVIDFRIQAPTGGIITPARALADPAMSWTLSAGLQYYRLVLPAELFTARFDGPGTWQALLDIGRPQQEPAGGRGERLTWRESAYGRRDDLQRLPPPDRQDPGIDGATVADPQEVPGLAAVGHARTVLPYSVIVHAYSSLSMHAELSQSGYEPGATVRLAAVVTEGGAPARPGGSAWAEVTRPDGSASTVSLSESDAGSFGGDFVTAVAGVYRVRIRASGRTQVGYPFQREQTLTAAVWRGGDRPTRDGAAADGGERLCRLIECLLQDGLLESSRLGQELERAGLDMRRIARCLSGSCGHGAGGDEDRAG